MKTSPKHDKRQCAWLGTFRSPNKVLGPRCILTGSVINNRPTFPFTKLGVVMRTLSLIVLLAVAGCDAATTQAPSPNATASTSTSTTTAQPTLSEARKGFVTKVVH